MKILLTLFVLLFSSLVFAETLKLNCTCFAEQTYSFETQSIFESKECSHKVATAYINFDEKWLISRNKGLDGEKRYFNEIEENYIRFLSEEDEYGLREKAIQEGKVSLREFLYYVDMDLNTFEWIDGLIQGEYYLNTKNFVPEYQQLNRYNCEITD